MRAIQQLPDLQGITAGPILELGGDVAEFDRSAAYRTEQFLDMLVGQRGELHGDEGRRTETRCVRVEFAGAMRAEDQHVAGRHRQQFRQQQQGVSIGPLQIVDRQDHRPIGRGVGYQPDDTAVEPVSRVGRIEVCHLRRLTEHLRELGHEISEKARQRGAFRSRRSERQRSRSAGPVDSIPRTIDLSASPDAVYGAGAPSLHLP